MTGSHGKDAPFGSVSGNPHVLREYSLLADGERGAVVGPRGDIVWMCAPRWHDPAIFSALIGGRSSFSVTPIRPFVWGGSYEEASMIWRSRWTTVDGIVESREALAFPADPRRLVLLRRVHAVDHAAQLDVWLEPRGEYDEQPLTELHCNDGIWTGHVGDCWLRVAGFERARPNDDGTALQMRLDLATGAAHDLVVEIADRPLPDRLPDPDEQWQRTEDAWRDAVPALNETLNPRDTRRSYAVLRGLTSVDKGMAAASTTSLPERAEAGRNYDYRYAWIRDQCYAGHAFAAVGGGPLLRSALDFVSARLHEHAEKCAPAYTVDGQDVPNQRHLGLPGYPGGSDIVGNQVNHQFQLDAFGEALTLFATAAELDQAEDTHRKAAQIAARAIEKRWTEPDAGVWEIDPRAWTHSRLTASAGLRTASRYVDRHTASDWTSLAEKILADTNAHALDERGYWRRSPDDAGLDAALLLPPLRGALPIDDPRSVKTFQEYLGALTKDGYAYRFRHDDGPLNDAEGSFLLCGFLTALTHHAYGNDVEARSWYDTTRAAVGPPQLFSEEYDAVQHQMRGNLPQAFVHALHIETAARLA